MTVRNSATWDINDTMKSDWNFDTIKSMGAMGTFRGSVKELNVPAGMILEDGESDDEQDSINTGGATKGSDPLVGPPLGMNSEASHSTIMIKSPPRISTNIDVINEEDGTCNSISNENQILKSIAPLPQVTPLLIRVLFAVQGVHPMRQGHR